MTRRVLYAHCENLLKSAPRGLTTDEIAKCLNCSVRTVRERISHGQIRAILLGPRYIVFKDWLIDYLVQTAPYRDFVI